MKTPAIFSVVLLLSGCMSTATRPPPSMGEIASTEATIVGPIQTITPVYPKRAAMRGLEGWVLVEFDVDMEGNTVNPRVVDSSPQGVGFEESALDVAAQYKYLPGKAAKGAQTLISFALE